VQGSGSALCPGGHALDSGPRGRDTLTTAHYVGYGNFSGTVQFLGVTKDDIGESRLALNVMLTSTTVRGIMTNRVAACLQAGVLMMTDVRHPA